ncbi:chitosanase [Streptomyces sp. NPDC059063]|uniref:chitosanase n=1 Tax=unclassified Streptomyces TaxID=2593676 RepID=UPI00367EA7B7
MIVTGHTRRRVAAAAVCLAALTALVGLLLWASGRDGKDDGGGGGYQGDGAATGAGLSDAGLSDAQRRRADQMVSAFENGTTRIQYGYAENLHDGRGITAGRIGFTTSDGDALKVIRAYTHKVRDNPLARFIPELERLERENSGATDGLPQARYVAAWKKAAEDPDFREVQDQQVDRRYYGPAMRAADRAGLTTPLARAELYDTAVQHGTGRDPDGLHALVDRTTEKVGTAAEAGEKRWLDAFLRVRAADLRSPANTGTADEWQDSVDRVAAVRRIAARGNYDLEGPVRLSVFGDTYTLR